MGSRARTGGVDPIRELFAAGPVLEDTARELREATRVLGEGPLVVRSSATAEDLAGASFAGQQDTYLDVRGEDVLLDAVRNCWASLWTARAMAYRVRQGIAPSSVSLAVVVQRMVDADAAGVMFTANPANGRRDETSNVQIDLVLIGGQYGSGPDGSVASSDFAEQVERSFANLGTALGAVGLDYEHVARLGTYIVDHDHAKLEALLRVISRVWGDRPPAQTLIGVAALALPDMLFEVDAIAVRP